eukprot:5802817-Amphidinium_carterae.2
MPAGMEKVSAAIKRELTSLGFPLSTATPSSDLFHAATAEPQLPLTITPQSINGQLRIALLAEDPCGPKTR